VPEPHATDAYKRTTAWIQYTRLKLKAAEMEIKRNCESDSDSESEDR